MISDTHGLLRPEAVAALRGVDRIVHAGDVGNAEVLVELRRLAPIVAVRGNNDRDRWARALPLRAEITIRGRRIVVVHDLAELDESVAADVVVTGHSHRPKIEERDGILFVNPGSAGPRRFSLPVSLARLRIGKRRRAAEIVTLTP